MNGINEWLKQIAHNYVLIVIAAILFFAVKAVIGFITYKHYDKQLTILNQKLNTLLEDKNKRN
ncbi:capsular polysaccharide biosynthesis protein [Paenibacillus sp. PvP094]